MRTCSKVVVLTILLVTGSAVSANDLVFIHHSVGQDWLDRGLRDALAAKSYIGSVHEITYGTQMSPDVGRPSSLGDVPGDATDMHHWVLWFNDYLGRVRAHDCSSGFNQIVMFKSCFPNSDLTDDGVEPGDPFSEEKTLANYKAVYRHPAGSGETYQFSGRHYRALEDVFAAHPDILFVPVTAPPLSFDESNHANAHRARVFNNWLKNDWLASYNQAHPTLRNVAVFDLFNELAYADNHATHPNRLKQEYGGASGDSHPNEAGDTDATGVFATNSPSFIDQAWAAFPKPLNALAFPAFFTGVHQHFANSFVGVAVSNPNELENPLTARGLSEAGTRVAEAALTPPIVAHGQRAFLSSEAIDPSSDSRTLVIQADRAPVRGFFLVGEYSVNRLDGVGDEWVEAETLYFPLAKRVTGAETTLYVYNPGEATTSARLEWITQNAQSAAQTAVSLAARACLIRTLGQLFPNGPSALDGYVRVTSERKLSGCLIYSDPDNFVGLPAAVASAATRLLAPHFYVPKQGGGTELRIINRGVSTLSVRVRAFRDGHGPFGDETREVAPGALWVADLATFLGMPVDQLAAAESYSGYLDLDLTASAAGGVPQVPKVVGCVVFSGNERRFAAALPLVGKGYPDTLFPHLAQSAVFRVFTGLATLNATAEAAEIVATAINMAGEETGRREFTLDPGERAVDLLSGEVFFGSEFSQVGGYLRLSSSQPLVSFALFGDFDLAYMAAIGGQEIR